MPPVTHILFYLSAGLFVPDAKSGSVVRIDIDSGETESIDMGVGKGKGNLEVFVKDDKLWVNNPNGSKAVVIDGRGVTRSTSTTRTLMRSIRVGRSSLQR